MFRASANDNGCRFGHHCQRRAGDVIKIREVDRKILITSLFYVLLPDFVNRFPCPTPPLGRPPLVLCGFIKSTPLEGQAAPTPWWWCLLVVCAVVDGLITSRAHRM
jgi:hypothetical protein